NPCRVCSGQGRVRREKTLSVSIPAGVEDGNRIRLSSEGEAGVGGGPPGDPYIFLFVRPHPAFQRGGPHIPFHLPLRISAAAMCGTIGVPSIDGTRAKLTVPAGAQTGRQFRLKSKGMSLLRSPSRGDMYIEVTVETPVNLTKRQQELLREFAEAGDGKRATSPEAEGFFSRVKEFFEDLRE